ncbi:hypothetical protein GCM10009602_31750 [Nocardiopsis tropica]
MRPFTVKRDGIPHRRAVPCGFGGHSVTTLRTPAEKRGSAFVRRRTSPWNSLCGALPPGDAQAPWKRANAPFGASALEHPTHSGKTPSGPPRHTGKHAENMWKPKKRPTSIKCAKFVLRFRMHTSERKEKNHENC